MTTKAQISAAGYEAGRTGRKHTVNPYQPVSDDGLTWFAAWHLAVCERESGEKIVPGLPGPETGLLMFDPEKKKDAKL